MLYNRKLFILYIYISLHLLIPNFKSIPLPWQPPVCSLCPWFFFCFIVSCVPHFRFHIDMTSYGICISLCLSSLSMIISRLIHVLQMALFDSLHCRVILHFYTYATSLSILLSMNIYVASMSCQKCCYEYRSAWIFLHYRCVWIYAPLPGNNLRYHTFCNRKLQWPADSSPLLLWVLVSSCCNLSKTQLKSYLWLIHVEVWQKTKFCIAINIQLKINEFLKKF